MHKLAQCHTSDILTIKVRVKLHFVLGGKPVNIPKVKIVLIKKKRTFVFLPPTLLVMSNEKPIKLLKGKKQLLFHMSQAGEMHLIVFAG